MRIRPSVVLGLTLIGLLSIRSGALLGQTPWVPNVLEPSDPNLFVLNWDVVFEVLLTIVLLAAIIERGLAVLFDSRWFLAYSERRKIVGKGNFKPLIAFSVAAAGCILWQFDALSIVLLRESWTVLGAVLTGAVVAGGSKGAVKLFRDVLDWKSSARREMEAVEAELKKRRLDRAVSIRLDAEGTEEPRS